MQHEWGRGGMHIEYWWESQKERDHLEDQDVDGWTIFQKERDHLEDQDVDGWTILKWILER
jgi:hypothetical protein